MRTEVAGCQGPLGPHARRRRLQVLGAGLHGQEQGRPLPGLQAAAVQQVGGPGRRLAGPSAAQARAPPMARKLTNSPAGVGTALPEGGWACSLCPQHRPHPAGHVAGRAAGHHRGDQAPPDSRHPLQKLHGGPSGKPGLQGTTPAPPAWAPLGSFQILPSVPGRPVGPPLRVHVMRRGCTSAEAPSSGSPHRLEVTLDQTLASAARWGRARETLLRAWSAQLGPRQELGSPPELGPQGRQSRTGFSWSSEPKVRGGSRRAPRLA